MFEKIVSTHHKIEEKESDLATEGEEINIKSEDANVVHYIAGYVCRKILAKISHSNKPGLELCVQGLLINKDDSETSPSSSTDWIMDYSSRIFIHQWLA